MIFFELFKNIIWRDIISNKIVYLVSVLGIALGVSIILAIDTTSQVAKSEFKSNISETIKNSNIEIFDRTLHLFNESSMLNLEWLYDINAKMTPYIEMPVLVQINQNPQSVKLYGIDSFDKNNISNFDINNNDFDNSINDKSCFVSCELAKALNLKKNSQLEIVLNGLPKKIAISGILKSNLKGLFLLQDIKIVQNIIDKPNYISKIFVSCSESQISDIKNNIQNSLPVNFIVQDNFDNIKQSNNMLKAFNSNLQSLGFISLLVGLFLMYNTMTNAIIRQRQNIAILRLLGFKAKNIAFLFLLEALVLAFCGSFIGILLGLALSQTLLKLVGKTLEHFYFQENNGEIIVNYWYLLKSFTLGFIATILASTIPIFESFLIECAISIKTSAFDLKALTNIKYYAYSAVCFILLGYLLAYFAQNSSYDFLGYTSALLFILGFILLIPFCIYSLNKSFLKKIFSYFDYQYNLAVNLLKGTVLRSSVAIASIMLSLALIVSLNIMITSFRSTVVSWLDQTLQADLFIEPVIHNMRNNEIAPVFVDNIKNINGVAAVDCFISTPIYFKNKITNLAGADLDVLAKYGKLVFLNNEKTSSILNNLAPNTAIVSECFAKKFNFHKFDTFDLNTLSGIQKFKIIGIYYDYASDLGYIVIQRKDFIKYFNNSNISSMAIYLKSNKFADNIKNQINNLLLNYPSLIVESNNQLKSGALKIFDRTFAVTYLLNAIATIVAMFTVVNVLYALLIENSYEYSLLYAIGNSYKKISNLIIKKVSIMSLIGIILGVILGFILSLVLIYVINDKSFGWTIILEIPYYKILFSIFWVVIMVYIAALLPIRILNNKIATSILNNE